MNLAYRPHEINMIDWSNDFARSNSKAINTLLNVPCKMPRFFQNYTARVIREPYKAITKAFRNTVLQSKPFLSQKKHCLRFPFPYLKCPLFFKTFPTDLIVTSGRAFDSRELNFRDFY